MINYSVYFDTLNLKPLSISILKYLAAHQEGEEITSALISQNFGKPTRSIDASITRSLQRYGFIQRLSRLTPLKRKDYTILKLTQAGFDYVMYLKEKKENKIENN